MAYDRCFTYKGSSPRSGSKRRQPGYGADKRGLNTKIHLAVDSFGMPVRVIVTDGTAADCSMAGEIIEGIEAGYLLADRAYDTDTVIEQAEEAGMEAVIPRRKIEKFNENMIETYMKTATRLKIVS